MACSPPSASLLLGAIALVAVRADVFSLISKAACAGRRLVPSQPNNCGDADALVHINFRVARVNRTHFGLSGNVLIREGLGPPLELHITGRLCQQPSNPTTCRTMVNMKSGDVCDRLDEEGSMWDDFMSHLEEVDGRPFPRTCPMLPGNYTLSNYMMKEGDLCMLYSFKGHWTYKSEISPPGCFAMNMEVADA
ncbi:hypothetical protein R5R35_014428 [Gryllus longicercus]|uniref:Uncharacterized protein n=1 Tax=Gryllus longicercus TaxID=2509291 RepID=A0AAN9VZ43_9ORTH